MEPGEKQREKLKDAVGQGDPGATWMELGRIQVQGQCW